MLRDRHKLNNPTVPDFTADNPLSSRSGEINMKNSLVIPGATPALMTTVSQMRSCLWLPLAAILLWPVHAKAEQQNMSVLLLHHICHDTDARSQSACSGFLTGLLAGLQMGTQMSGEGKPVCVPNTVGPDKLTMMLDIIVNDKPEFAALPGLEAIAIGLQSVFPCRSQQTPTPKNRTPQ
jgi:hypothetical protein